MSELQMERVRAGAYVRMRGWLIRRLGRKRRPAVRRAEGWRINRPAIEAPAEPTQQSAPEPESDDDLQTAHGWSAGSHWTTTAVRVAVWVAVACGPIALVGVLVGGPSGEQIVQAAPSGVDANERAATGEFAERFVTTWIETDSDNAARLNRFVELPDTMTWPTKPAGTAESVAVSGISEERDGLWAVTVAADVTRPGEHTAQRRYFRAAVTYNDGAIYAVGLPTPVAGPPRAQRPDTAYGFEVARDSGAGETITDFLKAMLAGNGDLARYISPGAAIRPINPVPYDSVEIQTLDSDVDLLTSEPSDGDEANVLVSAKASVGKDAYTPVEYALTLRSRDGRWEVAAVQPTPELDDVTSSDGSESGTSQ